MVKVGGNQKHRKYVKNVNFTKSWGKFVIVGGEEIIIFPI